MDFFWYLKLIFIVYLDVIYQCIKKNRTFEVKTYIKKQVSTQSSNSTLREIFEYTTDLWKSVKISMIYNICSSSPCIPEMKVVGIFIFLALKVLQKNVCFSFSDLHFWICWSRPWVLPFNRRTRSINGFFIIENTSFLWRPVRKCDMPFVTMPCIRDFLFIFFEHREAGFFLLRFFPELLYHRS